MVGQKIKELIENQDKHPNSEIARMMDISEGSLYRFYKRESVETKYLLKLCDIFDVPITYFFTNGALTLTDGDELKPKLFVSHKNDSDKNGSHKNESIEWAQKLIAQLEQENRFLKSIIEKAGLGKYKGVSANTAPDVVPFFKKVEKRFSLQP
jgi:transcriptional regulator with XRE-family HTH domain